MRFQKTLKQCSSIVMCSTFAAIAQPGQTGSQPPPFDRVLIRRGPGPKIEPRGPTITFNAVVVDAKGEPLRDLRATDFDIYDDGKLMHAAFCRPVESPDRQPAPPGPREYTNRPTGGKSTLVLLDLLNENLTERGLGWNQVVHAFQTLESNEQLFVYLLTKEGALYPIHGMPGAASASSPDKTDWVAQVPMLLNKAMHDINRLRPQEFQVNEAARVRKTFDVLRELASDFAIQPGSRSLVWISHGVPRLATGPDGMRRDYTQAIRRLGSDLARSGITVYAVDQSERASSGLNSLDTLVQLTGLTAGQWFPSNATVEAIGQAMIEGRATYLVGYAPPLGRWDNKFHKLRVTAASKGVRLRVRSIEGYFGDARAADPHDRFLLAALGASDDSGVGLRAILTPSEKVKGWTHFEIRVDATDLQLTHGETYTGEFQLTLVNYNNGWQGNASTDMPVALNLTNDQHDAVLRDGVSVSLDRPAPAGVNKVRIVVRDTQSGAVGSLAVPVASPSH